MTASDPSLKALESPDTKHHRHALAHGDGLMRCPWPKFDALYVAYHDEEWGVPVYDSRALFEKLVLDGFQAGLSWITILRKRAAFVAAFEGFDPAKIARFDEDKIAALMANGGIVRNRAKIVATVRSAQIYCDMAGDRAFAPLLWSYVGGKPKQNAHRTTLEVPAISPEAEALSADLRARGFQFVGPTIVYAFMQAVGMVNDHLVDCHCHASCARRA